MRAAQRQSTRSQEGEPTSRAAFADTMKTPEPIMEPGDEHRGVEEPEALDEAGVPRTLDGNPTSLRGFEFSMGLKVGRIYPRREGGVNVRNLVEPVQLPPGGRGMLTSVAIVLAVYAARPAVPSRAASPCRSRCPADLPASSSGRRPRGRPRLLTSTGGPSGRPPSSSSSRARAAGWWRSPRRRSATYVGTVDGEPGRWRRRP